MLQTNENATNLPRRISASILLHHKVEEIEAIVPIDLLRRASFEITTYSVDESRHVIGRSRLSLEADRSLDALHAEDSDCLIIPGGPGIEDLRGRADVIAKIRSFAEHQKPIAAICAAPLLLFDAGLLPAGTCCCAHASTAPILNLIEAKKTHISDKIITSRGAGTAIDFALTIIARLSSLTHARRIAGSIEYNEPFDVNE